MILCTLKSFMVNCEFKTQNGNMQLRENYVATIYFCTNIDKFLTRQLCGRDLPFPWLMPDADRGAARGSQALRDLLRLHPKTHKTEAPGNMTEWEPRQTAFPISSPLGCNKTHTSLQDSDCEISSQNEKQLQLHWSLQFGKTRHFQVLGWWKTASTARASVLP